MTLKKLFIILTILFTILGAGQKVTILAPATPSSIPVILAAKDQDWKVKLFMNHSRAHSLFLKGDAEILVTGLSVGKKFFEQEIPIKIINSFVSGLSYLVSSDDSLQNFRDLKGREIYLPFQGAPIEEVTKYFITQSGLNWQQDVNPRYAPFPSTVNMLLNNKIEVAILPEPFVTKVVSTNPDIEISISYFEAWNQFTGQKDGYPQVASFIKSDNEIKPELVNKFNQSLDAAINYIQNRPDSAVKSVKSRFDLTEKMLERSLKRTHFSPVTGQDLSNKITTYYQLLGKPIDETYQTFFLNY